MGNENLLDSRSHVSVETFYNENTLHGVLYLCFTIKMSFAHFLNKFNTHCLILRWIFYIKSTNYYEKLTDDLFLN